MHKVHSFIMKFLLVFTVLSFSLYWRILVEADNDNAAIEVHNTRTAFQECSHGDKKWRICGGASWHPRWYCPTVLEFNASHLEWMAPCFTCPDAESDCEEVVNDFLTSHNKSNVDNYDDSWGYNIADELVASCQELCEAGKTGENCSIYFDRRGIFRGDSCTPGSNFCDFASDEEFAMNISGTCKACPLDPNECCQDGFVTSLEGKHNCARCTLSCQEEGKSHLIVNGKEIPNGHLIHGAIQKTYQNSTGPLIDCSNLLLVNEDRCPGAEGHVCIVDYRVLREAEVGKFNWELSNVAEKSGCLALITVGGVINHHDFDELAIPFVLLFEEDGKQLLKSEPSAMVQVEVELFGDTCSFGYFECNINLPCRESEFCFYYDVVVDGKNTEGHCYSCPMFANGEPDPAGCFFDREVYPVNIYSMITPAAVESCAKACDATIISDGCKFCPSKVSAFDFGVEDQRDQCYFCPNNDVQYPNKVLPLFGENITCRMVQLFFNQMEVHKDSQNCRLVQSMNYMCGCDGTGYAGASTRTKQVVLVWLPRVAGFLSIAGSMFIIYDTMRTSQKRAKLMNQLLSTLSLFDIMGSTAYALATLPTPESDELYGAKGNKQTCNAQAFFIQIGTIACFLNVSLASYYLLKIKYDWTEERLKRKRSTYSLFVPPIIIGLVYAFVGIPHYENVYVWCNNSAKWWPEIPVILAVIAATGIMGTLCFHVYSIEERTNRYRHNGSSQSNKVFKQSCWFVAAFYITWVPYLTLQYMLSSGKGYNNYGLILGAATLVPLQGFWNSFVYIRPRYLNKIASHIFSSLRPVSSFLRRSSKANATEQSVLNSLDQSGPHGQLTVMKIYNTEGMGSRDDECNNTNISNEQQIDGRTLETTYRDTLDPNKHNVNEGALTDVSCFCEIEAVHAQEHVATDELLKVSTNKSLVDQEVTCSSGGKKT